MRIRPVSIRHHLPRQGSSLPINITNSLRLAKFEMAQFVWKTNGLPLTYSRFIFGELWFEHRKSSTQMKRLTNLALLRLPGEKLEFSLLMHEIKVLTN
jgi:hypothetical protein